MAEIRSTNINIANGNLPDWLNIYWQGNDRLTDQLLGTLQAGENADTDYFLDYIRANQAGERLSDRKIHVASNAAYQILLDLLDELSQTIHKGSSKATQHELSSLYNAVVNDIAIIEKINMKSQTISEYGLHYRLLSLKNWYFSIKLQHTRFLLSQNKATVNETSQLVELITTFLFKAYSSGIINGVRKNQLTKKYGLIGEVLSYLSDLNSSDQTRRLIEKAFRASRSGETNNNQLMITLNGSSMPAELLRAIEPMEIKLKEGRFQSLESLISNINKRDKLRAKYMKVLHDFGTEKKTGAPSWLNESPDRTLLIFFEGIEQTFEYISNQNQYQLIVHEKDMVNSKARKVTQLISNAPLHLKGNANSLKVLNAELNELHQLIIEPITLKIKSRIVIDPDGAFNKLPLAALVNDQGGYLLDQIVTQYQKSSSLSAEKLKIAPSFTWLQGDFSNPKLQLKGSEEEVAFIKDHFKVTGGGSGFSALIDSKQSSIFHIATHQVFSDSGQPTLLISDRDSIYRNDFFLLNRIPTSMILSACSSMEGLPVSGEGTLGFGGRAQEIGIKNLIGSLWEIEDNKTSSIMQSYFSGLSTGLGSAQSLQKAKKQVLSNSDAFYSHPFFWSSIVHFGEEIEFQRKRLPVSLLFLLVPLVFINLRVRIQY